MGGVIKTGGWGKEFQEPGSSAEAAATLSKGRGPVRAQLDKVLHEPTCLSTCVYPEPSAAYNWLLPTRKAAFHMAQGFSASLI